MLVKTILSVFLGVSLTAPDITNAEPGSSWCKCTPVDECWPEPFVWDRLNRTVSGRLVRSVPLGLPCHDPEYDEAACATVQSRWTSPEYHIEDSSSIQSQLFSNNSCNPFAPRESRCTLGKSVEYAIDVRTHEDAIQGIAFAKKHNIRLVIRNTGHCLMGKSTGYGALALWLHHLKDIEFISDYKSLTYNGQAVKIGAGVQTGDLYAAASDKGQVVVGGECPTVGLAGGYIQGGGHSALSSIFGIAADHVLEFEVLTADGKVLTANAQENKDLYWALSGGGGGTFGVVFSVIIRTFSDFPVSGANVTFEASDAVSLETWWEAVKFYQASTTKYTDVGVFSNAFYTNGFFQLHPFFAPKLSKEEVEGLLKPLFEKLEALDIPYNASVATYPSYLEAYNGLFPVITTGQYLYGGRLIPKAVIQGNLETFLQVVRAIVDDGASVIDVAMSPTSKVGANPDNAVNPAWRDAERLFIPVIAWDANMSWETISAQENKLTNVWGEALRRITPGAGAYLNEGDVNEPNWQQAFYGCKYQKLLKIKQKYDPENIFYAKTAVGSEAWTEEKDGKLCKSK